MKVFLKGYVSGFLAAPLLSSPILNTLTFSAAVLFCGSLTFFMPPLTKGPLLARLTMLALPPGLLGPFLLCPLLLSLARFQVSPGPGWALAVRTRYGRLSTAPLHLRPSEALCTGRGASRRRLTSVAASESGSSLPAALARRATNLTRKAGVRQGGASTALAPRSAGSSPCGRRSGRPASCARASPSLSPGGDPGL